MLVQRAPTGSGRVSVDADATGQPDPAVDHHRRLAGRVGQRVGQRQQGVQLSESAFVSGDDRIDHPTIPTTDAHDDGAYWRSTVAVWPFHSAVNRQQPGTGTSTVDG